VEHVAFGVVLGADNRKFKSRDGDTVRLKDLLDEVRRASLFLGVTEEGFGIERRQTGRD
jgi:arginyl-tRNA synthetase